MKLEAAAAAALRPARVKQEPGPPSVVQPQPQKQPDQLQQPQPPRQPQQPQGMCDQLKLKPESVAAAPPAAAATGGGGGGFPAAFASDVLQRRSLPGSGGAAPAASRGEAATVGRAPTGVPAAGALLEWLTGAHGSVSRTPRIPRTLQRNARGCPQTPSSCPVTAASTASGC